MLVGSRTGARLRRWRRNPLLAANHLATITLGMAAVTAVVSLMLAIAFQPLPFRDAAELVQIWNRVESGAPIEALTGEELNEMQAGAASIFASVGGFTNHLFWQRNEGAGATTLRVARLDVAAFRALDLRPVLGRAVDDAVPNKDGLGAVWISHNLWQSRYGGRSSVIGETIQLGQNNAGPFDILGEIAGVFPPDIRIPFPSPFFESPIDLWGIFPDALKARLAQSKVFFALGRLQPDRTLAEAHAALIVLADRRARPIDRRHRPVVQSFEEIASGPARRTTGLLAVGVALVLLLAFANLASLTVAEGSRRQMELFVRTSLGADRWRLWREIAAEHVALTVCALALGLPIAWITLRGLTRLVTLADIGPPLPHPPALNVYVLLGFAACALAATFVWATLIARRVEVGRPDGLRPADRRASLLRLGALSLQACLGIALMVLAVSMSRVYVRATNVNLGPAPDRTTFFSVSRTAAGVPTSAQAAEFTADVMSLVGRLPGVQATAFADSFPPDGSAMSFWKHDDLPGSPRATTRPVSVSQDYFSVLGIPIVFGRSFADADRYGGKAVAIIDLEMARRNWASPGEAVNAQIKLGSWGTYEVIGVAGSFGGYWAHAPIPTVYLSYNQDPSGRGTVILRTGSSTAGIAEQARQALSALPVPANMSSATTLQAGWQATATRPRARMVGMLLLAVIGIALGIQGVYALAASNVAARRKELAIRTALGASGRALVWLVLRQLMIAVGFGSGIGVLGIIAVHRLAPQWISVAVSEPAWPIALAIGVLLSTAMLGGLVPALSARWLPDFGDDLRR